MRIYSEDLCPSPLGPSSFYSQEAKRQRWKSNSSFKPCLLNQEKNSFLFNWMKHVCVSFCQHTSLSPTTHAHLLLLFSFSMKVWYSSQPTLFCSATDANCTIQSLFRDEETASENYSAHLSDCQTERRREKMEVLEGSGRRRRDEKKGKRREVKHQFIIKTLSRRRLKQSEPAYWCCLLFNLTHLWSRPSDLRAPRVSFLLELLLGWRFIHQVTF